jgi:hypothetical protein
VRARDDTFATTSSVVKTGVSTATGSVHSATGPASIGVAAMRDPSEVTASFSTP